MHLHHEIPLSCVRLSASEEAGDVADSYGMPSAMCRHRLPMTFPSPVSRFMAPSRARPSPQPSVASRPMPRSPRSAA